MQNKIVFLDRDGTINIEKNYLYKISEFEFLPGVTDGLKRLQHAGYKLVVITNQSGIARGFYSEHDIKKLHTWMTNQLQEKDIHIAAIYYCPHLPDASIKKYQVNCSCRKPKTGLFWQAIEDLSKKEPVDKKRCIAIGDKLRDLTICKELKCKGYLISDDDTIALPSQVKQVQNFTQAVDDILHNAK